MKSDYTLFKAKYLARDGERRESPTWHIRFRDHENRRQKIAASTHHRDAVAMAEKLMELERCRSMGLAIDAALMRCVDGLGDDRRERLTQMGLIDERAMASEKPLLAHLVGVEDQQGGLVDVGWKQDLESRGNTAAHVKTVVNRVKLLVTECGLVYWKDLTKPGTATAIQHWLGNRRKGKVISGTTYNYFIRDTKSFCRWLHLHGRAPAFALQELKRIENQATDAIERRALSIDEMQWLVTTTANGPERHGISGLDRAALYRFAFETGLRPNQIRSLTPRNFDFESNPPSVSTDAKYVKRRRRHV